MKRRIFFALPLAAAACVPQSVPVGAAAGAGVPAGVTPFDAFEAAVHRNVAAGLGLPHAELQTRIICEIFDTYIETTVIRREGSHIPPQPGEAA